MNNFRTIPTPLHVYCICTIERTIEVVNKSVQTLVKVYESDRGINAIWILSNKEVEIRKEGVKNYLFYAVKFMR